MIFLIEYDRKAGLLVQLREFLPSSRQEASRARLELEIEHLKAGVRREVVLLEANSEEDLRRTHNRYFRGVSDLAGSVKP